MICYTCGETGHNHMNLNHLVSFLGDQRIPHSTEAEMQEFINELLKLKGVEYTREAVLSGKDRIDFLVGRVGIECKIKGQPLRIHRQLERYLQSDKLDAIILITGKYMGTTGESNGKPIKVIQVGKGWL